MKVYIHKFLIVRANYKQQIQKYNGNDRKIVNTSV